MLKLLTESLWCFSNFGFCSKIAGGESWVKWTHRKPGLDVLAEFS